MGTAFFITCVTSLVLFAMMFYILKSKNKVAMHYTFFALVLTVFIWAVSVIFQAVFRANEYYFILFENISYFGSALVPVSLVFFSKTYASPESPISKKQFLLCVVPMITLIIIFTNQHHSLFFIEYGIEGGNFVFGWYFYFHAAYSFICLLYGFASLSLSAIKNSGITSIQALLILIGAVIPTLINILYTIGFPGLNVFSTPIAFTFTLAMYLFAMFRFNLLRVMPIALQTVINRISDSFIVVDNNFRIIDYNKAFVDKFSFSADLRKGNSFNNVLRSWACVDLSSSDLGKLTIEATETNKTIVKDIAIDYNGDRRYFTLEVTPITQQKNCAAVILLFKDITQHVVNMRKIQENQAILLERERLASLGQLIGGIAHNLKTPIMSVAGGIDQLKYLADEYDSSIENSQVDFNDHHEIAAEMQQWLSKMKNHLSYMSDIISTVKEQAAQFNTTGKSWFVLEDMLKRVKILMQHELIKNNCILKQDIKVDIYQKIDGDINSLVQILDNIIVNAIHSYNGKGGEILLSITNQNNNMLITICDFGKGIDDKIKNKLFKEMITTKGKHGTGLGLYMSYSTIKGVFRGDMWFESSEQKGTKFHIKLPLPEGMASGE